jgi:hypothetical protein
VGKVKHYAQLIVFDTLAVLFMIAALLTGWLPGPGGIPLFLVGLGLLAINHEWAQRYIDLLKDYADKMSDLIFTPRLRVFFDVIAPVLVGVGVFLLLQRDAFWMIPLGMFTVGIGLLAFFGNRNRWARLKNKFKHKH